MLQDVFLDDLYLSASDAQSLRRESFNQDHLQELADSIRAHGVLQPIVVRRIPSEPMDENAADELVLIAGERRYLAAKLAGLDTIPAVVSEMTDEQAIEIQLIENLQRAELHPMQEAEGYQQLLRSYSVSMDDLHARVGKSRSYIYKRLQLLELSQGARRAYYQGKINTAVAMQLARIHDIDLQEEALDELLVDVDVTPTGEYAKKLIISDYILQLKKAPFPTQSEDLLPAAGSCTVCPKRTGNQPELFDDIAGDDRCSDRSCYQLKVRAQAAIVAADAKAKGLTVIDGKQANKVAPYPYLNHLNGYTYAEDKLWNDNRKVKTIAKAGGIEPSILVSPHTGEALQVYKTAEIEKAIKSAKADDNDATPDTTIADERRKRADEKAFRVALWKEVRDKLPLPETKAIAVRMLDDLAFEGVEVLAKIIDWQPPEIKNGHQSNWKDWGSIVDITKDMCEDELQQLIQDMLHINHLVVLGHADPTTPKELRALAKEHGVNTRSLRAQVRKPKAKAKKVTTGKKKKDLDPFVHSSVGVE